MVEKVKVEIQEFFKLPMEEKSKYWQLAGELEGYGQAFVVSEEQKLDWADMFHFITLPTHLRKPHLLPNLPLPLRFNFYPPFESKSFQYFNDICQNEKEQVMSYVMLFLREATPMKFFSNK